MEILIKICLNETCIEVLIGKHLSDNFLIQNDLKKGDANWQLVDHM
jgi:hypothetical protein